MTTVAVPVPNADADELVSDLVGSSPLTESEAIDLLRCVMQDTIVAVHESGGDLVVMLESEAAAAMELFGWEDGPTGVQQLIADTLGGDIDVPIVSRTAIDESGTTAAILAELLASYPAASSALLTPITPFVQRRHVDAAAMRLRTYDLVLGPTDGCRWYFAGVSSEIAAADSDAAHLTDLPRAAAVADLTTDLLPMLPGLASGRYLPMVIAMLETAALAEKPVAPFTRAWMEGVGVRTDPTHPSAPLRRE